MRLVVSPYPYYLLLLEEKKKKTGTCRLIWRNRAWPIWEESTAHLVDSSEGHDRRAARRPADKRGMPAPPACASAKALHHGLTEPIQEPIGKAKVRLSALEFTVQQKDQDVNSQRLVSTRTRPRINLSGTLMNMQASSARACSA